MRLAAHHGFGLPLWCTGARGGGEAHLSRYLHLTLATPQLGRGQSGRSSSRHRSPGDRYGLRHRRREGSGVSQGSQRGTESGTLCSWPLLPCKTRRRRQALESSLSPRPRGAESLRTAGGGGGGDLGRLRNCPLPGRLPLARFFGPAGAGLNSLHVNPRRAGGQSRDRGPGDRPDRSQTARRGKAGAALPSSPASGVQGLEAEQAER